MLNDILKRSASIFILLSITVMLCITVFSATAFSVYMPGEIIVKYKNSKNIAGVQKMSDPAKKGRAGKSRPQLIRLTDDVSVEEAVAYYNQDPDVEYAEPNYIVRLNTIPNDPDFDDLWRLHNTGQTGGIVDADIDAPEAWELTTGSADVVIAVIDSGIDYNHPDLSGNIWRNTGETDCTDGIDNDGNGYTDDCRGWDFTGSDNDPADYNGHGTHVAGIIAAAGNNSTGLSGVMWQAKIMPLRFFGVSGAGTVANAVSAILYANAHGADVINISWGGSNYSRALKDAIDASDAVVVCAAGNSGIDIDTTPFYPAGYESPNIITVAATDHNDNIAFFSNYGKTSVDIGAPGINIYSTVPVFSYGPPVTVYRQDFDSVYGNLPLSGWAGAGTASAWAVTAGTGPGGSNSLEDSPEGDYVSDSNTHAGYMTRIVSVKDSLYSLDFSWKGDLENNYDFLDINYSPDGEIWDWIDFRTGTTNGTFITDTTYAFTDIADMLDSFFLGFGLSSDQSVTGDGVYIDNVELVRNDMYIKSHSYKSISGTSAAAPHISGIAGLIKALKPDIAHTEIINAILESTDPADSLAEKTVTGGRANAFRALQDDEQQAGDVKDAYSDSSTSGRDTTSSSQGSDTGNSGCFIATAAYGSIMHPYVRELSRFRDKYLQTNPYGKSFVSFYYTYSPPVANFIRERDYARIITRILLLPVVMLVVFPYSSVFILTAVTVMLLRKLKHKKNPA